MLFSYLFRLSKNRTFKMYLESFQCPNAIISLMTKGKNVFVCGYKINIKEYSFATLQGSRV